MPTPVGPAPDDPDDPDLWDWGADEDEPRPRSLLRIVVVGILVVGLVVLLLERVL